MRELPLAIVRSKWKSNWLVILLACLGTASCEEQQPRAGSESTQPDIATAVHNVHSMKTNAIIEFLMEEMEEDFLCESLYDKGSEHCLPAMLTSCYLPFCIEGVWSGHHLATSPDKVEKTWNIYSCLFELFSRGDARAVSFVQEYMTRNPDRTGNVLLLWIMEDERTFIPLLNRLDSAFWADSREAWVALAKSSNPIGQLVALGVLDKVPLERANRLEILEDALTACNTVTQYRALQRLEILETPDACELLSAFSNRPDISANDGTVTLLEVDFNINTFAREVGAELGCPQE